MSDEKAHKPDVLDFILNTVKAVKLLFWDVGREIVIGVQTDSLPVYLCLAVGSAISAAFLVSIDGWILKLFHKNAFLLPPGKVRDWIGFLSWFSGFYGWGVFRMGIRRRTQNRLDRASINSGLETKLKEKPVFYSDYPLDEFARKLTVRAGGLPVSSFVAAKDTLESNLHVYISKIENPQGNHEYVDLIYTTALMPSAWTIDNLLEYKDFSFPIGRSYRGEIRTSLKEIPHFLVAGESGGGKSTFLRMMLTVLLANNTDLEVYFLDFKAGMENQVFEGFDNLHRIDTTQDAAIKMADVLRKLENRMKDFKAAKARTIEMYNRSGLRKGPAEKRIIVVVDEVAELMPTLRGKANNELSQVNAVLGKISRMGRAVGITLVIGVQKPDAKNLDPTIKFNLNGILCFAVNHFSQSSVVLGNGRAADLNSEFKGRAIWKHGMTMTEVQTPLLTEEEVENVKNRIANHWGKPIKKENPVEEETLAFSSATKPSPAGVASPRDVVEVESP